jgi:hypothetical protein
LADIKKRKAGMESKRNDYEKKEELEEEEKEEEEEKKRQGQPCVIDSYDGTVI